VGVNDEVQAWRGLIASLTSICGVNDEVAAIRVGLCVVDPSLRKGVRGRGRPTPRPTPPPLTFTCGAAAPERTTSTAALKKGLRPTRRDTGRLFVA
jgi:hypothetical protein